MAAEATGMALLGIVMVAVVTRLIRLLRPPWRCGTGRMRPAARRQAERRERERRRRRWSGP